MPASCTFHVTNSTALFFIGFNHLGLIEARRQTTDIIVSVRIA